MRKWIRTIVMNDNTFGGRVFDWTIILLIVFALLLMAMESLPLALLPEGVSVLAFIWTLPFFAYAEIIIITIFILEMLARLSFSKTYLFSPWFWIDLLAITPTILQMFEVNGTVLLSLRAIRILKAFGILNGGRYGQAIKRLRLALAEAKEEMIIFFTLALIIVFISATLVYSFESEAGTKGFDSIFHSLWWAIATLTTVGYGDVAPVTFFGRFFTSVIILGGLGIVGAPAAIISGALVDARKQKTISHSLPNTPQTDENQQNTLIKELKVALCIITGIFLLIGSLAYLDPWPAFQRLF